jgi:hydroxymethylbilane synthase
MTSRVFRVGTRKSALALKQTEMVIENLSLLCPGINLKVVEMNTTGDFRRDKLNLQVQDKKQWIIELERALLRDQIDFAVHSGKDVPLNLEEGTKVISILEREDPRDIVITNSSLSEQDATNLNFLHQGAKIGTSSKRRKAQLLKLRPDLIVVQCRGNVPTRIDKVLVDNEFDAIILGAAGIKRLNINKGQHVVLEANTFVPAACQGTLACQFRISDSEVEDLLSNLSNPSTQASFKAERSIIGHLGADCHSALGVFAVVKDEDISISARVCSVDGTTTIESISSGSLSEMDKHIESIVSDLLKRGAKALL